MEMPANSLPPSADVSAASSRSSSRQPSASSHPSSSAQSVSSLSSKRKRATPSETTEFEAQPRSDAEEDSTRPTTTAITSSHSPPDQQRKKRSKREALPNSELFQAIPTSTDAERELAEAAMEPIKEDLNGFGSSSATRSESDSEADEDPSTEEEDPEEEEKVSLTLEGRPQQLEWEVAAKLRSHRDRLALQPPGPYAELSLPDILNPPDRVEAIVMQSARRHGSNNHHYESVATSAMGLIEEQQAMVRLLNRMATIVQGDDPDWPYSMLDVDESEWEACLESLQQLVNYWTLFVEKMQDVRDKTTFIYARKREFLSHLMRTFSS